MKEAWKSGGVQFTSRVREGFLEGEASELRNEHLWQVETWRALPLEGVGPRV